jgi:cyclopropane fatty-acyl-phospholipid synthase-like methyltransferase
MVTSVAGRSGLEIGRNTRILDFGCGWGRIIRPYMAKTEVRNLFGIEPNPLLLHVARSLNPYVSFVTTGYEPPTVFAPKSFDLVVSWSVFTHLPAQLARSWLDEFARLLRPGGLVFVTAWGTRFIDRLVESKRRMDAGEEIHWFSKLVISMVGDLDSVRRRFEAGEVVYARSESEPNYGDTFMSADGARSIMGDRLELVAHDDHSLAQDLIVYRRL